MSLASFWWVLLGITALVGASIGSFLNVVAWRLPAGKSLVSPPSACPACRSKVRPWDNIPVLSWLILRGRCRDCREPISRRYPLIEALCAGIWVALFVHEIPTPTELLQLEALILVGVYGAFFSALLAMSLIDADHFIIPDVISLPLIPIGIGAIAVLDALELSPIPLHASIFGATAGAGVMLFIALLGRFIFGREAMGMGDVKLVAGIGAWLGLIPALPLTIFLGSLIGSIVGIGTSIVRGGKPPRLPFGPYLCAGAFTAFLAGDRIVQLLLPELG
ncbi:MAG: prepilin peptidase [Myxococcota bacterium]|nr:prepilin peptidase [Myxococcota bacterium]